MKTLNNSSFFTFIFIFIVSLIVYHLSFDLFTINPSNTGWLLNARHDWGQHYLGWAFFRNDDWTYPLGSIKSWYYPMGTNVGLTDSIPLLAIFFKIFNPILGNDFQYFGLWIFSCFILNGFFSNKILKHYNISLIIRLIIIVFMITNPVLLYRGLHPALCAQWLILASIYLYILNPIDKKNSYKITIYQGGLILLSGLIHPYLTFIIAGFAVIIPLKNYFLNIKTPILTNILIVLSTFILLVSNWHIVGLIGSSDSEVQNGYGLYSWNFNSFYNPDGFSSFLPQLQKVSPSQYEGYSYLGLGILLAIPIAFIISIFWIFKNKISKNQFISIGLFLLWLIPLSIFGISNVITFNETILFTYPTPEIIIYLGNVFRATSRFIWLLYYSLFLGTLIIIAKLKINNYIKIVGLSLLLVIQIYDVKTFFTFRNLASGTYSPPLTEAKWNSLFKHFDHVITYPVYEWQTVNHYDYQDFGYLAAKNGAIITNAYVARADVKGEEKYKNEVLENILNDSIDNKTIYIVGEKNIKDFVIIINSGKATIKKIDDYFVIYSANRKININQSSEDIKSINLVLSKNLKPNNFELTNLNIKPTNNIEYYFEKFEPQSNYIKINGWGLIKNSINNTKDSIFIVLRDQDKFYIAFATTFNREDIANKYKNKNLENSGFSSIAFLKNLKKGTTVQYGLLIKSDNNYSYAESSEVFTIGNKLIENPVPTKVKLSTTPFLLSIDKVESKNNQFIVFGWSALENIDNKEAKKELILESNNKYYFVNTNPVNRDDVVNGNPKLINALHSGFITTFYTKNLEKGSYKLGLRITSNQNKIYTQMSDKIINIK